MSLQISNRALALKPSASIAAKKMVADLQAQGQEIFDLTIGEPDISTPAHIVEAAYTAMKAGDTHYTASAGTPTLRTAVAAQISREKALPVKPENIAVGCGAKQLIFEVFSATLNEGDEVIVPAPYWVSYPDLATLHGGKPVAVVCAEEADFKLTPAALEAAITAKTRWLVLNTPNNPSGTMYSRDELLALGEVLQRHPNVWVMTDEIYEYLSYNDERALSLIEVVPSLFERAVIINGMSKAYAMTGWRVGYAAGPKFLIDVVVKMLSQSTTCASSISQAAAVAALEGDQACVREATAMYRRRRDRMVEILSEAPSLSPRAPWGAFYLFISVASLIGKTTPTGKELRTDLDVSLYLLEEAKVAVLDGSAYGLSPYLRLSFAASLEVVESGSRAIVAAINALQ